jgi:uncharacterized repeat protein (TIGR04052 family)
MELTSMQRYHSELGVARALGVVAVLCLTTAHLPAQSAPGERDVTVRFHAAVGEQAFRCGSRFDGVGTSSATIQAGDFRFYVQNVRLIATDGREVPLRLRADSLWQHENVALLDFEDGTGPCANGTAETRDVVVGAVPEGSYRGVRFELGVPFALNHADLATLPPPLSLTRLFWAWNSGHKFMRVDLRSTPATPVPGDTAGPRTWMIHLGSTNCTPSQSATTVPTACAHPNRATITLEGFDPDSTTIVADLAALLAGANVLENQAKTAPGCMSSQEDADCAPLFASLGLPHAKLGETKPEQRFFRTVQGKSAAGDGEGTARRGGTQP